MDVDSPSREPRRRAGWHPVQPPGQAVLWRYMDFTRFLSLLDKQALFFARVDKLGDPFEGTLPRANIEVMWPKWYSGAQMRWAATRRMFTHFHRENRKFVVVNCWHEGDHETDFMWSRYASVGSGIAVKTDFASLLESIDTDESVMSWAGRVNYADYAAGPIAENPPAAYFHKRISFQHESEVRVLRMLRHHKTPRGELDLDREVVPVGTYVHIDLAVLVREVVVSPLAEDWFVELVQSVINKYDLKTALRKSELSSEPYWG